MNRNLVMAAVITATGVFAAVLASTGSRGFAETTAQSGNSPVLVELFTSEGCSSCPPADALLESLDRSGPPAIVLSEHVDYWNHIGWTDPFSSPRFSQRQQLYATRLHLDSVYTPQMIVDGTEQFVGSDRKLANAAIARSARGEKAVIRIVPISVETGKSLRVRVEVDPLPSALQAAHPQVYLAVAMNEATSQVRSGENGGRRLHHVAVVRSLNPIGMIQQGDSFANEVSISLDSQMNPAQLRLVAFIQEQGQGKVFGAVMQSATP